MVNQEIKEKEVITTERYVVAQAPTQFQEVIHDKEEDKAYSAFEAMKLILNKLEKIEKALA